VQTLVQGIAKLLNDVIYSKALSNDGDNFRRQHCYNVKTNEILKKNEAHIKKVYEHHTHAKQRYIKLDQCQAFVRKVGLNCSEMMVGAIYAESMMTIVDTIRDQTRPNQMKYVEFLVFLCRVAHEHFKGGPYEKEESYLKLDHLMPVFLSFLNLQPIFLFGEKFTVDIEAEHARARRRKKKLRQMEKQHQLTGEPIDKELKEQVEAYEEKN